MAAQLKRTHGLARRGLSAWMSDATSSLPVPVSPRRSTVTCRRATRRASSRSRRNAALDPTSGRPIARSSGELPGAAAQPRASTARAITARSSSSTKGLVR
jgi:hypothetical protein